MANCQFCNSVLSNNKPISLRCSHCGAVWCANGNCSGSMGRKQSSRSPGLVFQVCRKSGGCPLRCTPYTGDHDAEDGGDLPEQHALSLH